MTLKSPNLYFQILTQLGALKGLTYTAWVFETDDPKDQKIQQPLCNSLQLEQLLRYGRD